MLKWMENDYKLLLCYFKDNQDYKFYEHYLSVSKRLYILDHPYYYTKLFSGLNNIDNVRYIKFLNRFYDSDIKKEIFEIVISKLIRSENENMDWAYSWLKLHSKKFIKKIYNKYYRFSSYRNCEEINKIFYFLIENTNDLFFLKEIEKEWDLNLSLETDLKNYLKDRIIIMENEKEGQILLHKFKDSEKIIKNRI